VASIARSHNGATTTGAGLSGNAATTQPRAAIYVRVSTAGQQEDGTSPETQEAECRAYAARHGLVVSEPHVYREVHTGAELWQRPLLTRLRAAMRRREVDAVVVHAIDRLSRDPVHLGVVLSEAEYCGVEVHFVTEPLDNTPEGYLIRFVRGYAARIERERIKERTMRGKLAKARAGERLRGPRPRYGYRWNEARTAYVEDPLTAPIVRQMFNWAASGVSLRGIAERLTTAGVPSPTGRERWRPQSVRDILTDPMYMGVATTFRHQAVKNAIGTYTMRRRPLDEQVPLPDGTVPALVHRDIFEAVTQRLAVNRQWARRNLADPTIALLRAGFVRCGYCGSRMAVDARTPYRDERAPQYVCMRDPRDCEGRPRISTRLLDTATWGHVVDILTHPEVVAREVQRLLDSDPVTADLEAVERQIAATQKRIDNLTANLADLPPAAAEAVRAALVEHVERLRALEQEREHIQERRYGWQRAIGRLKSIEEWCATVATRLDTLDYEQKRLALFALGVQVRVWRTDHTPRFLIEAGIPLDPDDASDNGPDGADRVMQIMARCPASS
jgi:site-specific DNA recombinase